jgi:hypothetical protein
VQEILRRVEEQQDECRGLKRQIAKTDALRDSLQQELENMRIERQAMLDSMHALEVQIIEHGQARFEARLAAEREAIDQSYKSAFADVKTEVAQRVEENKALQVRLAQDDSEVNSMRAVVKRAEEERDRLETMFKSILSEREAAHEADLRRSLEDQHNVLQDSYVKLVQQQVDSLMVLIQKQSTQHSSAQQVDGESCFDLFVLSRSFNLFLLLRSAEPLHVSGAGPAGPLEAETRQLPWGQWECGANHP